MYRSVNAVLWLLLVSLLALAAVMLAACQSPTRAHKSEVEMVKLSEWAAADPQWAEMAHAATTPQWTKETLPRWVLPYLSGYGRKKPMGSSVAGIDRWHAQTFIWYTPETARYLYSEYSPPEVHYKKGSLPTYEAAVQKYTAGLAADRDKAVALVTKAMPELCPHPGTVPYSPRPCPADRALMDEPLLQSGRAWCNEQARVFIRLCQVAGIPARMVFIKAHVVAEFYADAHWSMADASNYCVFPDPEEVRLMSAQECHQDGPTKLAAAKAYQIRFEEMAGYSVEQLYSKRFAHIADETERDKAIAEAIKKKGRPKPKTLEECTARFNRFGMMNYPLPPECRE